MGWGITLRLHDHRAGPEFAERADAALFHGEGEFGLEKLRRMEIDLEMVEGYR